MAGDHEKADGPSCSLRARRRWSRFSSLPLGVRLRRLILGALAAVLGGLLLREVMQRTHRFQAVTLPDLWRGPRPECEYLESLVKLHKGEGLSQPSDLHMGLLVLHSKAMWPQRYTDLSLANKKAYADLHGYELLAIDADALDVGRPGAWAKIVALQQHLSQFHYLTYMDVDALIMNPAVKLEWFLPDADSVDNINAPEGGRDVTMTEDWGGPNTGIMILRNSSWTHWLLREWWAQDQFVEGRFPFEYEQRGLHYLLQTPRWRNWSPPLPVYGGDSKAIWARLKLVPQCALNAYIVHPLQMLKARVRNYGDRARYMPGDFIIHFAGKKGRTRQHLMDYYSEQAERAMEAMTDSH